MRWGYRSVQTQRSEKHRKLYRKRHKHCTSCRLLRLRINICQFLIWLTPCQGVEQVVDDGRRKILLLAHLLPRINDKATMTYTGSCVSTYRSVSAHFHFTSAVVIAISSEFSAMHSASRSDCNSSSDSTDTYTLFGSRPAVGRIHRQLIQCAICVDLEDMDPDLSRRDLVETMYNEVSWNQTNV